MAKTSTQFNKYYKSKSAFFNAVGSIFGLYTGSAFECYFNYKEMFPLAAQRGIFFLVSPFVVTFVVGILWLPAHFFQD